ncbi:MAG: hypothetical protein JO331_07175 [Verrucomicrobia bacterium]|nr:hypothetical protein [Verrucomicrobiota bacterium]
MIRPLFNPQGEDYFSAVEFVGHIQAAGQFDFGLSSPVQAVIHTDKQAGMILTYTPRKLASAGHRVPNW